MNTINLGFFQNLSSNGSFPTKNWKRNLKTGEMKKHIVKIKSIGFINYNILQIVTEKPENYDFEPGQATEIAINQKDWKEEKRPFTFTNLPREDDLQFTIKVYPSHDGVTEKLSKLKVGNELVLGEVFGAIQFKGKGTFLAGGAGITPFIAIFKSLEYQNEMNRNSLIFANKTEKDIFLKQEFETLLGRRNSKVSHRSYRRGLFEIYHNRFFTVFLCLRPTGK